MTDFTYIDRIRNTYGDFYLGCAEIDFTLLSGKGLVGMTRCDVDFVLGHIVIVIIRAC